MDGEGKRGVAWEPKLREQMGITSRQCWVREGSVSCYWLFGDNQNNLLSIEQPVILCLDSNSCWKAQYLHTESVC